MDENLRRKILGAPRHNLEKRMDEVHERLNGYEFEEVKNTKTKFYGPCQCGNKETDIFIFDDWNNHFCSDKCLAKYGNFEGDER